MQGAPRNQKRNVINQRRTNRPSVPSIDISSCPVLPSDKEAPRAPSRQGKETKQEVGHYLSHDIKKRSCYALFVRKRTLGDEQRATRKHEIRPEYYNNRTGKPVGPIGLTVPDKGEENISECRQEGTDTCRRLMPLSTQKAENCVAYRLCTRLGPFPPIRQLRHCIECLSRS